MSTSSRLWPLVGGTAAAAVLFKLLDDKYRISGDIFLLRQLISIRMTISKMQSNGWTVADMFEQQVDTHKDKRAVVYVNTGSVWSYRELDAEANRVAHWALSRGYKRGDVVALFMTNRPQFLATWLGLTKVGITAAFINCNLVGKPLMHCFRVSAAKAIIFDEESRASIEAVRGDIAELTPATPVLTVSYGGTKTSHAGVGRDVDLNRLLPTMSADRPAVTFRRGITLDDTFGFVYTSGTTGMPKAALISHLRFTLAGSGFLRIFCVRPDDVVYTVLPLYHSAGGMIGAGMVVFGGVTMVLRDKFSTSRFWPDVAEHRCTVFQYIGELCRYLLLAKTHPLESKHRLRIAMGNGLRPDIWDDFQTRFNIPEVGEFYGATEGNVALFNHCVSKDARGAVGRSGLFMRMLGLNPIVQFDDETEEPVRNKAGFCIPCAPGVPGEMLGLIKEDDPTRKFSGYHGNAQATKKKVLTDVFVKGDKYFRTGDLLKMDEAGYYYFVDRIGDTFRWKGENVATTEVAEVCSSFPGIAEVNVYGVAVPGKDGRAGCAALTLTGDGPGSSATASGSAVPLDLAGFAKHCASNLPVYARPVFVRILPVVPITGTFKHQKVALRKEGADPTVVPDPLFYLDTSTNTYQPLDAPTYLKLCQGGSKL